MLGAGAEWRFLWSDSTTLFSGVLGAVKTEK